MRVSLLELSQVNVTIYSLNSYGCFVLFLFFFFFTSFMYVSFFLIPNSNKYKAVFNLLSRYKNVFP